nr:hypothetical protein [Tanacetum cinerariifolium]
LWYPKASPFDLVAFSDSDYGGASQDRRFQYLVVSIGMCKLFPLLGKLSTVSVFLGFGLTFAG